MERLLYYFPELNTNQLEAFRALKSLYEEANAKVNVISRKDMDQFYVHHVLHSLTLSAFVNWNANCKILDLGTGGGFPVIPLAILMPQVRFTAIDGTGKKIKVVQEVIQHLKIKNVEALHVRAEDFRGSFHFVISRAVTQLDQLIQYARHLVPVKSVTALPNGLIAFKGGNLKDELSALPKGVYLEIWDIHDRFPEAFFEEKKLIYVQL